MNQLSWIIDAVSKQGFTSPGELIKIVDRGELDQSPFFFSTSDEANEDTERMTQLYPTYRVMAFGRRGDYDGVVCLVVADCDYPKGAVLVLHWDGGPGTEVDEEYPSLAVWAKAAEEEINERIRMSWNEPSWDGIA